MEFLRKLFGAAKPTPKRANDQDEPYRPPEQIHTITTSFLQSSRAFYECYEHIREELTGDRRELDASALWESMAFFLFVVDVELHFSGQTKEANDKLFYACHSYLLTVAESQSLGTREAAHEAFMSRMRRYGAFIRSDECNPRNEVLGMFADAFCSPVVNLMDVFRGRKEVTVDAENAPMMIRDMFQRVAEHPMFLGAFFEAVAPFQLGLRHILRGNSSFLLLSPDEIDRRIRRGKDDAAATWQEIRRNLQNGR